MGVVQPRLLQVTPLAVDPGALPPDPRAGRGRGGPDLMDDSMTENVFMVEPEGSAHEMPLQETPADGFPVRRAYLFRENTRGVT